MTDSANPRSLTRRQLLSRSTMLGASFVIGAGFMAAPDASWATETTALTPETFATLVQMARDIYPHDKVGDQFYVIAVKGYDSADSAATIEAGIAALNAAAQGKGFANYLAAGWEDDRVAILRGMEKVPSFSRFAAGL